MMKLLNNIFHALFISLLFLGCAQDSFKMQTYADKWFNNKTAEKKSKDTGVDQKLNTQQTKSKKNVAEKIAYSSIDKRDEKMQGKGTLQKNLDKWKKEEWEPAFKGDNEQTKKDKKAKEHFTIQHYVEKIEKYLKLKEKKQLESGKPKPEANYEKINKLPVIGK